MKILWLSHLIPYPPKAGVLLRAYNMLREISQGNEVDLIAFNQENLIRPLLEDYEEGILNAKKQLESFCCSVSFHETPIDKYRWSQQWLALKSLITPSPYNIAWLQSSSYRNAVAQALNEKNYDLVHIDTISLIPYFDLVRHIPTVLDHHNIESHMLFRRSDNESHWLKKLYFKQEAWRLEQYEKNYCPKVTLNISCSDMDSERLKGIAPNANVLSIANGVDIEYFKPLSDSDDGKTLIFAGTLNWYPNIEAVNFIAEQLWPKLKQAIPDIRIDIIGANPQENILQLSQREKNFCVHGFVNDLRPYLDNAAICLCPITDGGGTKLKVLDAFAMAKTMIAHPIACEGIDVINGVNVYFAETADDYIDAITKLLNNSGQRQKIGRNARQLVEDNYSYHSIGEFLRQQYERLCDKNRYSPEKQTIRD